MKSKELLLSVREMLIGAMQDYPFPASDGGHGDLQVFLHGLPEDQRGTTRSSVSDGPVEALMKAWRVQKAGKRWRS